MAAEAPSPQPIPISPLPFGYFACRKRILIFQKFQNLIRHHAHIGTDLSFVPPLETLLPPNTKPEHRRIILEREINKLILPVSHLLREAWVQTNFIQKREKQRYPFQLEPKEPEVETISYDVIQQYFYASNMKIDYFDTVQAVLRVTDQGIGAYEFRKATAIREAFNPALWIAHLIRLPIWILQRAGFSPSQKFYESFIKTLMFIILALLALKLGFITSKDLIPHLIKSLGL